MSAPLSVPARPGTSNRTLIRLGRAAAVVGGSLTVIGSVVVIGSGYVGSWWSGFAAFVALVSASFAVFVWLVTPRQPRNAVVWVIAASALLGGIYVAGVAVAALVTDDPARVNLILGPEGHIPADLPSAAAWILVFVDPPATLALFAWLTFGLLLFPDGRLPSPRWRWVAVLAVVGSILASVALGWSNRPTSTTVTEVGLWIEVGLWLLVIAAASSLVALVGRFRRAGGATRQQFKWIVWGASIFIPTLVAAMWLGGTRYNDLAVMAVMVATALFVGSYGIAVGKYRLYDIDAVINRTVMVTVLATVITVLYVAIVVGVGSLLGSGDGTQFGVQVGATVVVAVAFGPARRRAQQWANRVVYGQRATPYEVLARFSHRAADSSDDELLRRIPKLIVDGTGALEATLWVNVEREFRAAATWPENADRPQIPWAGSFEDPGADYSLPVFHRAELLGGLSLVKARDEALPTAEKQLVASLASGMGLALRNARLTSRLREQVRALEASRERLLAAADEARRTLERDLDSGPQQQLVALKVMLGPTRRQAVQAGAAKTGEILAQIEAAASEAIRAVRQLSSGVYPPLLAAEGLTTAITQQTQQTTLPIAVEADGVGRYSRDVEAAVYFTILEALQNVAKYASASAISVVLQQTDGELTFEVTDDGRGFDPAAADAGFGLASMADRLDAVGGTWSIDSAPGSGTTVRGTVPIKDRVGV